MTISTKPILIGLLLAHVLAAGWAVAASAQASGPLACAIRRPRRRGSITTWAARRPSLSFRSLTPASPSTEMLPGWNGRGKCSRSIEQRTRITVTWRDPATKLDDPLRSRRVSRLPGRRVGALSWGTRARPPRRSCPTSGRWRFGRRHARQVLHAALCQGRRRRPGRLRPAGARLGLNSQFELRSAGGRSSNGVLPFFNVEMGGRGLIEAVGWTGNWAPNSTARRRPALLAAGMQHTHLKLAARRIDPHAANPAALLAGRAAGEPEPAAPLPAGPSLAAAQGRRAAADLLRLLGRAARENPARRHPVVRGQQDPHRRLLDRRRLVWRQAFSGGFDRRQQRVVEIHRELAAQQDHLPPRAAAHRRGVPPQQPGLPALDRSGAGVPRHRSPAGASPVAARPAGRQFPREPGQPGGPAGDHRDRVIVDPRGRPDLVPPGLQHRPGRVLARRRRARPRRA